MVKYEFLKTPYLPMNEAKVFIADAEIEGAEVIKPYELTLPENSLKRHADLSICVISPRKAVCPPESCAYYRLALEKYNFSIIEGKTNPGKHYPSDCAYNVCIVGDKCFLNTKACDEILLDALKEEGKEIIDVGQGYTKCSVCPIDENTIITADARIFKEAEKRGMECLLISNEGIFLEGYDYGFFGGASGMLSKNVLLVNGETDSIKSGKEIEAFLQKKKIEIKALKKGVICDIGSVIPIME